MATAKYIAEKNNILLNVDERLWERKFGVNNISELPETFFEDQFRNWNYKLPNGESADEVSKRMNEVLLEILSNNKDRNVAIVSHGTAITTMLKRWCNIKLNEENKLVEIYFKYNLNEINIANNWNPKATNGKDFGGFNYCSEECILRWLHRGNTIYDVEIPHDAENIRLNGATTIYRTNKIIIKNPRKVDDELALHFYKISKIPEKSYYKALGVVSIMNYKQTAYAIFRDKVNKNNIDQVLEEWNDFISLGNKDDRKDTNALVKEIENYLYEVKSELLISRFVDKEPYIKYITDDKVINITGESGSGKSTYTKKYLNDDKYIVIDTDEIIKDRPTSNKNCIEFREYLKNKYNDNIPNIYSNFSIIYSDILEYYKNTNKTLVIDLAQFRNLMTEKELNLLKGKVVIIRTSIEECYKRVINRWKETNKNYTEEELEKYKNKKIGMFEWYKSLNDFIINLNKY